MTRNRIYLLAPVLLTSIMVVVLVIMPGLALASGGSGVYFVDDCDNTLKLLS